MTILDSAGVALSVFTLSKPDCKSPFLRQLTADTGGSYQVGDRYLLSPRFHQRAPFMIGEGVTPVGGFPDEISGTGSAKRTGRFAGQIRRQIKPASDCSCRTWTIWAALAM